jgi:hypothetical protein
MVRRRSTNLEAADNIISPQRTTESWYYLVLCQLPRHLARPLFVNL